MFVSQSRIPDQAIFSWLENWMLQPRLESSACAHFCTVLQMVNEYLLCMLIHKQSTFPKSNLHICKPNNQLSQRPFQVVLLHSIVLSFTSQSNFFNLGISDKGKVDCLHRRNDVGYLNSWCISTLFLFLSLPHLQYKTRQYCINIISQQYNTYCVNCYRTLQIKSIIKCTHHTLNY